MKLPSIYKNEGNFLLNKMLFNINWPLKGNGVMNAELGFRALCAYKMVLCFFPPISTSHKMHAVHLLSENDLAAFRLGTILQNIAGWRRQVTQACWKEGGYGCVWEEARTERKVRG